MTSSGYDTFDDVKRRLDEIVDAVSDDNLPLDDALALYEEAVGLGLRASDLLERNIEARDAEEAARAIDGDAPSPDVDAGDAGASAAPEVAPQEAPTAPSDADGEPSPRASDAADEAR